MIKPVIKPIAIQGKLSYLESLRAFAVIRLKRKIIDIFPQLQENQSWCYHLEYPRSSIQAIKLIEEAGENVPFLLYIYPENEPRRNQ